MIQDNKKEEVKCMVKSRDNLHGTKLLMVLLVK
jgi:hypothetical protein